MRCQWQAFMKLLPQWLQEPVDRLGKDNLTELRLRVGRSPELILTDHILWPEGKITTNDLNFCINAASRYSPWSASSMSCGYLTAQGGHRIGICGEAVMTNGICTGFRTVTSLCIRLARDFPGIADEVAHMKESILIIGPPGSGKTTFLRDLIRSRSNSGLESVAVLDERGEIFPVVQGTPCFSSGKRTDILSGMNKGQGIISLIRTMGPSVIAVDEITEPADCDALIHAMWCGVKLLATAHASCVQDLRNRAVYKPLLDSNIFDKLIILQQDKSWKMERIHYDS